MNYTLEPTRIIRWRIVEPRYPAWQECEKCNGNGKVGLLKKGPNNPQLNTASAITWDDMPSIAECPDCSGTGIGPGTERWKVEG